MTRGTRFETSERTEPHRKTYTYPEPIPIVSKPENHDEIQDEWNSIADTFHLLMGAKTGALPTPMKATLTFDGTEAEARGSLRHVCEQVEDEGYDVTTEHVETTESAVTGDERHRFTVEVTQT